MDESKEILGLPEDKNKLMAQLSQPLLSLWKSEITISEFKILSIYLGRIKSDDPAVRTVRFLKKDLVDLMGVTQITKDTLAHRLRHLMGNVVEVPVERERGERNRFRLISLFSQAEAVQNGNGNWEISLTCTPEARQYIFNIEKMGYIKYLVGSILTLRKSMAAALFIILENERRRHFGKSFTLGFDWLKDCMGIKDKPTYEKYYRFNDLVLKPAQRELTEKSDFIFTYEPAEKRKKFVVAIRFMVVHSPMDKYRKIEETPCEKESCNQEIICDQDMTLDAESKENLSERFGITGEEVEALLEVTPSEVEDKEKFLAQMLTQAKADRRVKNIYRYTLAKVQKLDRKFLQEKMPERRAQTEATEEATKKQQEWMEEYLVGTNGEG